MENNIQEVETVKAVEGEFRNIVWTLKGGGKLRAVESCK